MSFESFVSDVAKVRRFYETAKRFILFLTYAIHNGILVNKAKQKTGIWNPVPFFISLQMSFIIPLIFAFGLGGLEFDAFLYMWPIRWFVAYCLINFIVMPLAMKLAMKVFNYNPGAQ